MQTYIKSTYHINSIMYDILGEFASDYDSVDEHTYSLDLLKYINYHCYTNFSQDDAADILEETYVNPCEYLQKKFPELFDHIEMSPIQWLQIILMIKLADTYDLDLVMSRQDHLE